MEATRRPLDHTLWGVSLIVAPVLLATSTFFWEGREYGIIGGALLIFSTVFWIPAFLGIFDSLCEKMPYYSTLAILPMIYGCVGGSMFGFRDIYATALDISHEAELQATAAYEFGFNAALYWPGPLFPLSLLLLGVNLMRGRSVHWSLAMLVCLGALLFPLSRILRL